MLTGDEGSWGLNGPGSKAGPNGTKEKIVDRSDREVKRARKRKPAEAGFLFS
jgi:hypothetical protein